jgi:hypothetical protein
MQLTENASSHPWRLAHASASRHLDGFAERHAQVLFKAHAKVFGVLALMSIPAVWASLNLVAALIGVGLCGVAVLLGRPFSRRDARKREHAFRALDWARGIAFVSPNQGLVYLSDHVLALESKGRVGTPSGVKRAWFDEAQHRLNLAIWMKGRICSVEPIELPQDMSAEEARHLTDGLALVWHLENGPTPP